MRKYEAIFILKPNLSQEEIDSMAKNLTEPIIKNKGTVSASEVWMNKKKFTFPIKKHHEGIYYRVNFEIATGAIDTLKKNYRLNENILRLLISNLESKLGGGKNG